MRLRQYILIGLFGLLCTGPAIAQRPSDYGFSRMANVPSQRVYSLLIARDGFVWIASELGVFRYDGLSFTPFYNEEQSALAVVNLAEDAFGRIWCQNSNGQIFYIEKEQMRLLKQYKSSGSLSNFAIAGNELLAFSKDGLFTYNLTTRKSKVLTVAADGTPLDTLRGGGLKAYRSAAYFLLKVKDSIYICRYQNNSVSLLKPALQDKYVSITAVNKHRLIMREKYDEGLSYFDIDKDSLIREGKRQLPGKSRYILSSVTNGEIWIHLEKESFPFQNDTADKIKGLSLTNLVKDREGNIWASSLTYGLLLKRRKAPWQFFPVNHATGYVTSFVRWRGRIIATTSEGYLLATAQDSFLTASPDLLLNLQQVSISGALPIDNHLFVYGTPDLLKLDENLAVINRLPLKSVMHYASPIGNKMLIFNYYSGVLLVPTDLNTSPDRVAHLPKIISRYFGFNAANQQYANIINTNKRSRCSYYDSAHRVLYVAFSNGLYAFGQGGAKALTFDNRPIHAYDIIGYNNKLYIATLKRGILVLNGGRIERSIQIPRQAGQEALLKIKLFGTHLWILSANNIYVYDIRRQHFIHTIPIPPLKGIQVFDLLEYKGYVYFSTTEGIYKVPLADDQVEVLPINYLLSVVVNSRDTLQNNASLSYNQNRLQFNLAGLYYFNPKGVYFKYRLLGGDGDTTWKQGQPGLRDITFPNLMPDDYTFEAVAYTANGLSSDKTLSFSFTINKVWWEQWWFILSIVIVAATLAYVIITLRINSRKAEHLRVVEKLQYESDRLKLRNMVNESELKALKSQMNPHFISNSLNNIQELIMRGDKIAANEQLSNFATLARLILLISGKRSIPLATEIHLLKNYLMLEGMRLRDNFKYDIIMEEDTDEWAVHIPPMIIQPFVENSVKHGLLHREGDKRLTITFKVSPDAQYLKSVITDNGIGREKAAEMKNTISPDGYDSFSVEAIRKRLSLMGKETGQQFTVVYTDLKDNKGAAAGTSVSIRIPILTP